MPKHYWRIHAKVTRRVWGDLSQAERDEIANDVNHESELTKWFIRKVNADAQRIFEDPLNYENDPWSFRVEA